MDEWEAPEHEPDLTVRAPPGRVVAPAPVEPAQVGFSATDSYAPVQIVGGDGVYGSVPFPADAHGTAGPNHVVMAVNAALTIQPRTIGSAQATMPLTTFFSPLGPFNQIFDPRVVYDRTTQRYYLLAACDGNLASSGFLMAVSSSNDPTQPWRIYRWDADGPNAYWADHPRIGFNDTWIAIQANMMQINGTGMGSQILAISKADLVAGVGSPRGNFWQFGNLGQNQAPVISYDSTPVLHFIQAFVSGGVGYAQTYWISGGVGTAVWNMGPALPTSPWSPVSPVVNSAPQLGSAVGLHLGDDRINSAVFRNGSIWATHSVFIPNGAGQARGAVQIWKVSPSAGTFSVWRIDDSSGFFQFGFSSISANLAGDALVTYSIFSSAQYPSVGMALRLAADPAGVFQSGGFLKMGQGPIQAMDNAGRNRWGDYSSTVVDPNDDRHFFAVHNYAGVGGQWAIWWSKIRPTESAPQLAAIPDKAVPEGGALLFTVSATDQDGDPIVYRATSLPVGASFDAATRQFQWAPDYSQAGTYLVTFYAADPWIESSTTARIVVSNTNRTPTLSPIPATSVRQGENIRLQLSAADPDGDALTWSTSNLPPGSRFDSSAAQLLWEPATTAGTFSPGFTVSDGSLTATRQASITVRANSAPSFGSLPAQQASEGTALSFVVTLTDPDGDPCTKQMTSGPAGASFDAATGRFQWTPAYDQAGSYVAVFNGSDGVYSAAPLSVSITVLDVNRAPVLRLPASSSWREGEHVAFQVDATDPDGDALTLAVQGLPPGASISAAGAFDWAAAVVGDYTLAITVSDKATSTSGSLLLSVRRNLAPVWDDMSEVQVAEGEALSMRIRAMDPDGDPVTLSAEHLPAGAQYDQAGTLAWTPGFEQAGAYTVDFTASDGLLVSRKQVSLVVTNTNRAPVFAALPNRFGEPKQSLAFTVIASDPDGDSVRYSARNLPPGAQLDPESGAFEWIPTESQRGEWEIAFEASDGKATSTATAIIAVGQGCGCSQSGAPSLGLVALALYALRRKGRRSSTSRGGPRCLHTLDGPGVERVGVALKHYFPAAGAIWPRMSPK